MRSSLLGRLFFWPGSARESSVGGRGSKAGPARDGSATARGCKLGFGREGSVSEKRRRPRHNKAASLVSQDSE